MATDSCSEDVAQASLKMLQQLLTNAKALSGAKERRENKQRACSIARKLWLELEEPGDLVDRIIYQTQENAILQVALDLDIYCSVVRLETVNSLRIATETGADPILVERIMRNLAALGHIEETAEDTYKANKFTAAFNSSKGIAGSNFSFHFATPAWNQIPAFLKNRGYENPADPLNAPLQRACGGSSRHFFDLMVERGVLDTFQTLMSSYRTGRAELLDIFPADDRLIDGFRTSKDNNDVLLVDVGGGRGHEIIKFVDRYPDTKGRMILQEQADVIEQVPRPASDHMELMVHDFFAPQPIKGARSYHFRMILHDWPDAKCVEILKNVASVMTPGYSKVLINDIVLPNQGATRFATQSDINMLALLASMERSELQWRRLLNRAGLEIIKVWPGIPESVIEATLSDRCG